MGFLERIGLRESTVPAELVRENEEMGSSLCNLQERITELELALEDVGWTRLAFESGQEFSRAGLRRITALSQLFFLKNPLINRAVTLQAMYVWGQGVSIQASHPDVDAVVQAFLDDEKNKVELTSHQARTLKEQDLEVEGNIFFVLSSHALTGRTRVRTIPVDEITEIMCNPEDRREPWYYKREWAAVALSEASGLSIPGATQTAFYPDWRFKPAHRPQTMGGHPVHWESPVYHVKVGGLSSMRFGVPETYSGLDWARAYKEFLEDWATIVRAYSKFAWKATTPGGKKGIAAIKSKLGTAVGASTHETNPPPLPGSMAVMAPGHNLEPIRTAGATTKAEDGRRLLLMVAAATGLPETFFGDVSVGTLATAKQLDRPTELKFRDRQTLWADIHEDILEYVIDRVAAAPRGRLRGTWELNDEMDERHMVLETDPETGEPINRHIDIDFPSILEHDQAADIEAIAQAAPLLGSTPASAKIVARLLLTALGQDDIDDLLDSMFPEDEEGNVGQQAEEAFVETVREVRDFLKAHGHDAA